MSLILSAAKLREAAFSLMLASLILGAGGIANAGDFDAPGYTYRAPGYERMGDPYYAPSPSDGRYEAAERQCRTFHERRVDPYGREVMHRIRMCDEGPVYPDRAMDPAQYSYPTRPRYERSGYEPYPRPPAAIGGY